MPQQSSALKLTLAAACASVLAMGILAGPVVLMGCNKGNDNPLGPTAQLTIQIKRADGFTANAPFNVNVHWQGHVTQESSSDGATSFDETKNYTGSTDLNGDWTAKALYIERRPGKWELTIDADGWSHTCTEITLVKEQMTTVSLTWGKPQCALGPIFP
jgi:hypothetical protein